MHKFSVLPPDKVPLDPLNGFGFWLNYKRSVCSGSVPRPTPEKSCSVWNRTKTASWWIPSVNRWSPRDRSHRTQVHTQKQQLNESECDSTETRIHIHLTGTPPSPPSFLQTTGWTRCWGKLVEPTSQSSASPSWTRRARTASWRARSSPASNSNTRTRLDRNYMAASLRNREGFETSWLLLLLLC